MSNYPDGMTQQDHDREFDRKPEDEPEKFFWYEFYDVVITIRARSKAEAIEMVGSSVCGMLTDWPSGLDIDINRATIMESEE